MSSIMIAPNIPGNAVFDGDNLGTPASSHIPKTCILNVVSELAVDVSVTGCLSFYVGPLIDW